MNQWHEFSANRRALAFILFTGIVLSAVLIFVVLPTRREIADTRREKQILEARIEAQKILHPLYDELQRKTSRQQNRFREDGLSREKLPARVENAASAAEILVKTAKSAGLEEAFFSPAPESVAKDGRQLLMQGEMSGAYESFREFLLCLALWSRAAEIEQISIKSGTRHPDYRVTLWVRLS